MGGGEIASIMVIEEGMSEERGREGKWRRGKLQKRVFDKWNGQK